MRPLKEVPATFPQVSMDMLAFGWDGFDPAIEYAVSNQVPLAVHVRPMEVIGWERAVERLAASGVVLTHLMHGPPFSLTQPEKWSQERERLLRSMELVHQLGASVVEVNSGPPGPLSFEEASDRLAEAVGAALPESRRLGVDIAVEPIGQLRPDIGFAHTLRDVVALARHAGLSVCLDSYWCWRERDLPHTIAESKDLIRLVQLSDNLPVAVTNGDRAVPGDGVADLHRLLTLLVESGYNGYLDMEILGPRIAEEGGASAVTRGIEHLASILARVVSAREDLPR